MKLGLRDQNRYASCPQNEGRTHRQSDCQTLLPQSQLVEKVKVFLNINDTVSMQSCDSGILDRSKQQVCFRSQRHYRGHWT